MLFGETWVRWDSLCSGEPAGSLTPYCMAAASTKGFHVEPTWAPVASALFVKCVVASWPPYVAMMAPVLASTDAPPNSTCVSVSGRSLGRIFAL
ncbi:hypothetical protein GA0115253_1036373 [Streptomyces sp. Termitarium-T10T-6]|nr:hypothetical protein GA0115253_1036373 [Streptomyces sp. Termitarium-T10T-6]